MMKHTRTRWLIVIAALVMVLAACSSGSDDDGVASLEDSSSTTVTTDDGGVADSTDQEKLNEFAACMRDNGAEDFEDPIVNDDGSVEFDRGQGMDLEPGERETMEAAFEACADLLEGLSFGPGGEGFDITELEDQLVAFATCMRGQGIDMDDPDLTDFAPGGAGGADGGPFGDIDIDDPEVQAALEVCQAEIAFGQGAPPAGG